MSSSYSFCYTEDPTPIQIPNCTYRTVTTPERRYFTNANGQSKYLIGGRNYPIRIIRNNFNDLSNTNFSFSCDLINRIYSSIPITEYYYLNYPNGIKHNNRYIPQSSTSSQLTNNLAFIETSSSKYSCNPGDFGSKIRIGTNNNSITVTCGNNDTLDTSSNNLNDPMEIEGFILRIYPNNFFNNFNLFINNPKNQLIAQSSTGVKDLANMSEAINGLIRNNFNSYMYDWTGIIKVPNNYSGTYIFKLTCQEANGGDAYLWIGDEALSPTTTNYLINDNINAITTIPASSVQVPVPCERPPPCVSFNSPTLNGGTISNISSSGLNYTIATFKYSANQNNSITFHGFTYCDILVVGGGGGGGGDIGGGGGGGQVLYNEQVRFAAGTYIINVGQGGSGSQVTETNTNNSTNGNNGNSSSISLNNSTLYNASGGYGGYSAILRSSNNKGGNGGANGSNNNSANGYVTTYSYCGGGGGGSDINTGNANNKNGGNGQGINITGTTIYYGAGGGGGAIQESGGKGGSNSSGGNGNYSSITFSSAQYPTSASGIIDSNHNAKSNTGSGGGGGGYNYSPSINNNGGNGADGIIIFRYANIQNGLPPTEPELSAIQAQSLNSVNSPSPTPTTPVPILQIPIPAPVPTANVSPIAISGTNESYMIFTSPSANNTITFRVATACNVLIVGGGGPGGPRLNYFDGGAGGGGGVININFTFEPGTYNITVGDGGISNVDENGQNSSISGNNINTIIAGGGGRGGYYNYSAKNGYNEASGGGSQGSNGIAAFYGGRAFMSNNMTTYSNFGRGGSTTEIKSSGGGGNGGNANNENGGAGTILHIIGSNQTYGSGGAGTNGSATSGGGGFGSNGVANTGGGGGGNGGNGGSGVVIIRYSNVFNS